MVFWYYILFVRYYFLLNCLYSVFYAFFYLDTVMAYYIIFTFFTLETEASSTVECADLTKSCQRVTYRLLVNY